MNSIDDPDRRGNAPRRGRYVTVISRNDVQLGRGRPVVTSEGNQRFRQLVLENRAEYTASARHAHKDVIARRIYETIRDRGGNFIQKIKNDSADHRKLGIAHGVQAWLIVDEETSLQKVKQALRENETPSTMAEGNESESTPPRKKLKVEDIQEPDRNDKVADSLVTFAHSALSSGTTLGAESVISERMKDMPPSAQSSGASQGRVMDVVPSREVASELSSQLNDSSIVKQQQEQQHTAEERTK